MNDFESLGRTLKDFSDANPTTVAEAPATPEINPNAPMADLLSAALSAQENSGTEQSMSMPMMPPVVEPVPQEEPQVGVLSTPPEIPMPRVPIMEEMPESPAIFPTQSRKAAEALDRIESGLGTKNTLDKVSDIPNFTTVGIEDSVLAGFAKEYNPSLVTSICVADKQMLLQYMVSTERRYNVTLSFPAYGVDPIVFDEAVREAQSDTEHDESAPVVVAVDFRRDGEAAENPPLYEKILVDGVLYFSCISECLDENYLHKVITEATESVYMHNQYVYTLVGPRPLTFDDKFKGSFIETLKLNSYELSVLLSYMDKISGVTITHGVFDGHSAIMFKR